jgi:exonuclease SbcC
VVFDDVLTATDSGRLARVMAVLEEAAERLQVLVLTCHPERYRGLRRGRFFDFENLVRERGGG